MPQVFLILFFIQPMPMDLRALVNVEIQNEVKPANIEMDFPHFPRHEINLKSFKTPFFLSSALTTLSHFSLIFSLKNAQPTTTAAILHHQNHSVLILFSS
jgi:hypothetical protein